MLQRSNDIARGHIADQFRAARFLWRGSPAPRSLLGRHRQSPACPKSARGVMAVKLAFVGPNQLRIAVT
jgi:hypothetical protein